MNIERFEERAIPLGILGLKVTKKGEDIAYKCWEDECRRNVYSASKSFTSCAVGIAQREGLLSVKERLIDAFAEDLPDKINPNLEKATVEDLLTMCLGQEKPELMGAQRPLYLEDDWVRMCLSFPFTDEPGTKFLYNNVGPYLAGVLVQRRAGCDLVSYLRPRLFMPLGIKRPTWECDPLGYTFGAGGLFLTLSELHRFGQLYLKQGEWNGKQLVPQEWIAETKHSHTRFRYGYLFWLGEQNSYRADGKYGQYSIILDNKETVISVTAWSLEGEKLRKLIFEELYPQL